MARKTQAQRGYGKAHQTLRRQWENRFRRGEEHNCERCGEPVDPNGPWDLGHTEDRTAWTGPEHVSCNRKAGQENSTKVRVARTGQPKVHRVEW